MALGVYAALAERGLRIPDDVSVVGFDDLPEAHWISPTLTTIRQPTTELGAAAVKLLLDLAKGDDSTVRLQTRMELTTELVARASSGPAPRP
jgi:DNA-binding LacI/PurR family transcriptional regulator